METDYKYSELSDQIIRAFYKVYNTLGYGFQEKVYANALAVELRKNGHEAIREAEIEIYYEEEMVGEYYADILVDQKIIVEIKATRAIVDEHIAQLLNYLKATIYEVGLLLNFGPEPEIKRRAYDNSRKGSMSWIKK